MNLYNRTSQINTLKENGKWDVIIIGGGATGLGTALDSASRGFKTLVLEQHDFAKGTSSRSTKLVHGGVRYLAQGQLDLVREALKERGLLHKNAAHLVKIQSFIIPVYKWWNSLFYNLGLKAYDLMAFRLSFGKSERITRKEVIERIRNIRTRDLFGGVVYFDGQFDDSRLAINIAQTAIDHGASVLNYFSVTALLKDADGLVEGVVAVDLETMEKYSITAKAVINASGVFTDAIINMDSITSRPIIRPSQGIHLVLDKSFLPGTDAIMIPKTKDGRVLFLVPWQDKVLVGTTDTMVHQPSLEPKPLDEEIQFIIDTANKYITKTIFRQDVLSMFAGLRPLAYPKNNEESTKEISRSHKILISESGLITIVGGKWTTYRKMAEDVIDKVIELKKLPQVTCSTENLSIHGSTTKVCQSYNLSRYGTDVPEILELIKAHTGFSDLIHPEFKFIKAEIYWAIRNEMARTVEDILARRIRLLFLDARAAMHVAPIVAHIMATELGRNEQWIHDQIKNFNETASQYILK